jgi:FkbM family methyltransferase
VKSRRAQHAIQTARGCRIVTPSPAFLARQITGGSGTYAIRSSGVAVALRHRTRDIAILTEIYGDQNPYEPPAEAARLLTGPIRVRDLGGNIGLFGAFALARWKVEHLTSYEPDPANLRLLYETAAPFPEWSVVPTAASNRDGTMRFITGVFSESREAAADEPGEDIAVADVFAQPAVDLLKLDIEGGEWPMLADDRLGDAARVIVMEWHLLTCPSDDGSAEARRLLATAGYTRQYEPPSDHDDNGILWAWRP